MLSSFSGRSWEQEADSRCFLSARCSRGKTLWRKRSFFGFTCSTWQRVKSSPAAVYCDICCTWGQHCVPTRSKDDPREYFLLTLRTTTSPREPPPPPKKTKQINHVPCDFMNLKMCWTTRTFWTLSAGGSGYRWWMDSCNDGRTLQCDVPSPSEPSHNVFGTAWLMSVH